MQYDATLCLRPKCSPVEIESTIATKQIMLYEQELTLPRVSFYLCRYDITLSIGDGLRPGCIAGAARGHSPGARVLTEIA